MPTNEEKPANSIHGLIEDITFHNSASLFTVLEMNVKGELVCAVGFLSDAVAGEEVTLLGDWVMDSTYGRQFRFTNCERTLPDTEAKVFRYLAGGAIKGIGPKLAARITEKFGADTVDVLENHPERLQTVQGISAKKAVEISASFKKNFAMRRMLMELENYGISATECTEIYKFYGPNSVSIIRQNPYILCEAIRGFSFNRTEKLCQLMGLQPDPIYRNSSGIISHMKLMLAYGHTYFPLKDLIYEVSAKLGTDDESIIEALERLIDNYKAVKCTIDGVECIYLPELFVAEKSISQKLKFITAFPPSYLKITDDDIEDLEEKSGIFYAENQKLAIKTAIEKGLLVLTGGPGTGKTTTVKGIIEFLENKRIDVKLCAPTGRAAKRLSEVTDREAKTIHRLLEVEYDDHDKMHFARNRENPLKTGALIIDEMSMVDTELCAALLEAVPLGCRVIMVGDSDQLPSVGPGNVLNDIINSGVTPVICLNEIFRQARQSLIVMNAHALMEQKPMELKSKDSDFFLLGRGSALAASELITDLVSKRLPEAYSYNPYDDIQVLCPSRKGCCGTENLNTILQNALNPFNKFKAQVNAPGGKIFREGDKVMQTKNNYDIEWRRPDEDGAGIFNGDIGIIEKINHAGGYLRIRFDDRIVEYPFENMGELDFAYAITVHKSQGSEYPAVIIPVIDCPYKLMYRNLLYTGITRAKRLLILVGNEAKVYQMANNTTHDTRYSGLKYFLTEE